MAYGLASSSLVSPVRPPKLPSFPFHVIRPRMPSPVWCGAGGRESSAGAGGGDGGGKGKVSSGGPRKKRSSYGTSRRSVLKKTFSQEQVSFTSPVAGEPTVGIIGGGISGLVCAATLEERGIRSTVFDTGVHGLGGRMGTRMVDPHRLVFDHAAQFFTVSDPRFQTLVDRWIDEGLVREWKGLVGNLEVGGDFVPAPPPPTKYIGVKGMRPLADFFLSQSRLVNVVRPCWISKVEPFNGLWHLTENGKSQGHFDSIVFAHNGKCANRLLSSSGLPLLARQMKRLELSSIWALLAAFDDALPIPRDGAIPAFEGAFVRGSETISWMANNSRKLFPSSSGGPHCWTFFSSASYGRQNKVPQANIPKVTAEKVKADMLGGAEMALGLSRGCLQPFYTRVQLWGAALPTNTPNVPCIFDPHGRAGICGDWLLGSSVEAAVLSGISLAEHELVLIFHMVSCYPVGTSVLFLHVCRRPLTTCSFADRRLLPKRWRSARPICSRSTQRVSANRWTRYWSVPRNEIRTSCARDAQDGGSLILFSQGN
ncbi:hypothetical protein Taro_009966 [Colocasia esculenta]|uniref:FAD/NAD(P)-binding oxidoreductase family protein n=1 Tax=Colocasia esculenta TaxID=4460 RepID=A0A843UBJ7_COLES|nr:hypothetical protein [Colocasia esculenta]